MPLKRLEGVFSKGDSHGGLCAWVRAALVLEHADGHFIMRSKAPRLQGSGFENMTWKPESRFQSLNERIEPFNVAHVNFHQAHRLSRLKVRI